MGTACGATLRGVSETAYDDLPRPPLPDRDGSVRDVWAEFSGYGPAGPGHYRISVAELVEDGLSHFWPRLVWDGHDWTPPGRGWFLQHLTEAQVRRCGWGPERIAAAGF